MDIQAAVRGTVELPAQTPLARPPDRVENNSASTRFPFELARIRLARGIRLRHTRDARPHARP